MINAPFTAEDRFECFLVGAYFAVFGVDRQIEALMVFIITSSTKVTSSVGCIVRALAVCLARRRHDLRGLFLRRLLDDHR